MPNTLHMLGHTYILQYCETLSGLISYVGYNIEPYVTVQFALSTLKIHAFTSYTTMGIQESKSVLMLVGDDVYVFFHIVGMRMVSTVLLELQHYSNVIAVINAAHLM